MQLINEEELSKAIHEHLKKHLKITSEVVRSGILSPKPSVYQLNIALKDPETGDEHVIAEIVTGQEVPDRCINAY